MADAPPKRLFEELGYEETPLGPISLRRRWISAIGVDVQEVILRDEHLMSSLFTVGEASLSRLGLEWATGDDLRVLVGGLGLGFTAAAALEDDRVASVEVAEYLAPVIAWHRAGLTSLGASLSADPRCRFTHADFFELVGAGEDRWDVILLDIDHAPDRLLAHSHGDFYSLEGLKRMAQRLTPAGVFALWSDDGADAAFLDRLGGAFGRVDAVEVAFPNPLTGDESTCTSYRAQQPL